MLIDENICFSRLNVFDILVHSIAIYAYPIHTSKVASKPVTYAPISTLVYVSSERPQFHEAGLQEVLTSLSTGVTITVNICSEASPEEVHV